MSVHVRIRRRARLRYSRASTRPAHQELYKMHPFWFMHGLHDMLLMGRVHWVHSFVCWYSFFLFFSIFFFRFLFCWCSSRITFVFIKQKNKSPPSHLNKCARETYLFINHNYLIFSLRLLVYNLYRSN